MTINLLVTTNTLLCSWMFKPGKYIILHEVFSSNSEAFASELQEHIEEIFLRYYVQNIILSLFISHQCVTRCKRINSFYYSKAIIALFHTFPYLSYISLYTIYIYFSICCIYFPMLCVFLCIILVYISLYAIYISLYDLYISLYDLYISLYAIYISLYDLYIYLYQVHISSSFVYLLLYLSISLLLFQSFFQTFLKILKKCTLCYHSYTEDAVITIMKAVFSDARSISDDVINVKHNTLNPACF